MYRGIALKMFLSTEGQRMIKHLACIMDGNRRWARNLGWETLKGHSEGASTVKKVIGFCLEKGISYLSLYAFSIENFNRTELEKNYLFDLIARNAQEGLEEFINKGIRVRFIGDRSLFPAQLLPVCEDIEEKTKHLNTLHLNFLFCYGARQEIIGGIKQLVRRILDGRVAEADISAEMFQGYLWTGDIPEPDLIIRTGKVRRLSNFLLYQAAYSEFYFLDCLWPELTTQHLESALASFDTCQRNFGK